MGRELKRVPLDFNYPIDQVWKGYINPYRSQECKACGGSALNPATKKISDDWYASDNPKWVNISHNHRYNDNAHRYHITEVEVEALVKAGRLSDLMPQWVHFNDEKGKWESLDQSLPYDQRKWVECAPPIMPTPEAVNEWALKGMGHDSCNHWICTKALAQHLGVYGHCEHCDEDGQIWASDEIKKLYDEWERFDPPTGEGYQLWTTTNEGSPITPVFSSLELLCEYAAENCSTFAYEKASKEEWMRMLGDDGMVVHQVGNAIFI